MTIENDKTEQFKKVIPNNNNDLKLAVFLFEDNDLLYFPIIGWCITVFTNYPGADPSIYTDPITVENMTNDTYGVYDIKTDNWYIPESRTGKNRDSLLKALTEDHLSSKRIK